MSIKEAGLNDHPSREEVVALYRGGLSPERAEEVSRHLLAPCASCLDEAAPALGLSLAAEPPRQEAGAEEQTSHDAAIDRAVGAALRRERSLRRQRAQARKALRVLEGGGLEALDKLPPGLGHFARMEAFLARSWQLRHDDPQLMVHFAVLATEVSRRLDARELDSPARVTDFQARAQAELGNAYRAADRLHEAADALGRARRLFERGTRDELLEVRLLELEASLAADRCEFGRASASLLKVADFYSRHNDAHRVGRVLVKLGLYAGYAGNPEKGIGLLEKSLTLVDAEREPSLACAAAHNLVLLLAESGRFPEAKRLRFFHARLFLNSADRINGVKFRVLEGRIHAGLGNHSRAASIFREVIAGFEKAELPILANIERLYLAVALLAQGKAGEAFALVLEAAEIFARLEIQREALMAVVLLRDAVEMQTATLEMVEEVARFLRRIEIDPALRFEGRAWED
jgi:tetratricopeptide (TPR) repeat protein